jgi:hypothetical protein
MTRQRNKERQKGKRKTKGNDKQGKTMNISSDKWLNTATLISCESKSWQQNGLHFPHPAA